MNIEPFTIQVTDDQIEDLRERLRRTRFPSGEVAGGGWRYGASIEYLERLVDYWANEYEWRDAEALLNSFPNFRATIDELPIHFVYERGKGPNPLPLVITHGWPGSFYELHKIIGPLTDPAAHGGDPADAFHVVVPSLPGFGFSGVPNRAGYDQRWTAKAWVELMGALGYDRFGAQGGDWGAFITAWLGYAHPEHLLGIHMNMVLLTHQLADRSGITSEEEAKIAADRAALAEETAYYQVQSTRPQTLSFGLTDSPAGLAAWIIEKWRAWSDCGDDLQRSYTMDELLTNVSIYWFTTAINSSARYYYEFTHNPLVIPPGERVAVPAGFAIFPHEIVYVPRAVAETVYDVHHWGVYERGGHFAAMEVPDSLVESIREFYRPLRR